MSITLLLTDWKYFHPMAEKYQDKVSIQSFLFFVLAGVIWAIAIIPFALGLCDCFTRIKDKKLSSLFSTDATTTETTTVVTPETKIRSKLDILDWADVDVAENVDITIPEIPETIPNKEEKVELQERVTILKDVNAIPRGLDTIEPMAPHVRKIILSDVKK